MRSWKKASLKIMRWWGKNASKKIIADRLKYLLLATLMVFTFVYVHHLHQMNTDRGENNTFLERKYAAMEQLGDFEVQEMNVTKYAPLDPSAVKGMDYSGDRQITASGEEVMPGETAASGGNLPFGTRIYVEGKGWYKVEDRGGRIGTNDLDLVAETREEALAWGNQQRLVIIEKP